MRKFYLFRILLVTANGFVQNGYIHDNGDPRMITPTLIAK